MQFYILRQRKSQWFLTVSDKPRNSHFYLSLNIHAQAYSDLKNGSAQPKVCIRLSPLFPLISYVLP